MPTYEYACRDCGHHLEVVQSFTDDPLTECPSCQGNLRKVFSPIGITFKGSGFYKTDSRSSSSSKAKSGGSSSSESTSTSSSDAASTGSGTGSDTKSSGTSSDAGSTSAAKSA